MNRNIFALTLFLIASAMLVGCGRKASGTNDQIKAAVQAMAQAKSASPIPEQKLHEALAAFQSGNYQDAVTQLQTMRLHTEMTGEQLLALNQAIAAVMNDLYGRAAKGDDQAQAAIQEYGRLRNSH